MSPKAEFWAKIFENIRLHPDIAVQHRRQDRLGLSQEQPEAEKSGQPVCE